MFEFRFYAVAHGRMASELALVHDMAVGGAPAEPGGPPAHEQSLWDFYGVPRPVGSWTVLGGRRAPGFLYIMKWNSLAERDERFPRFWTDPSWRARRAELTDGAPLVDSIENWLMEPLPAWIAARGTVEPEPVGGMHEMRIRRIPDGMAGEAADTMVSTELPALETLGARVLGIFEVAVGPDLPAFVTLLAWPNLETQQRGWAEMDRQGRTPAGDLDQYLLEPMSWNLPPADFGVRP